MSLDAYLDHFGRRTVQDALNEATAAYWLRRAATFEWARPRPGERVTTYTAAIDERCAARALACRRHATICEFPDFDAVYEAIVAEQDAEHPEAA